MNRIGFRLSGEQFPATVENTTEESFSMDELPDGFSRRLIAVQVHKKAQELASQFIDAWGDGGLEKLLELKRFYKAMM